MVHVFLRAYPHVRALDPVSAAGPRGARSLCGGEHDGLENLMSISRLTALTTVLLTFVLAACGSNNAHSNGKAASGAATMIAATATAATAVAPAASVPATSAASPNAAARTQPQNKTLL